MTKVKITTIGNSAGIILTKEILAMMGAQKGDELFITRAPDGANMSLHDERFASHMEAAEQVMRENRNALRKLAE